jgi:hypothetical protein
MTGVGGGGGAGRLADQYVEESMSSVNFERRGRSQRVQTAIRGDLQTDQLDK